MRRNRKDWDRICRELSSPESSDAEDEGIDARKVLKNAPRIAELARHVAHEMRGANGDDAPRSAPPRGTNNLAPLVDALRGVAENAPPLPRPSEADDA